MDTKVFLDYLAKMQYLTLEAENNNAVHHNILDEIEKFLSREELSLEEKAFFTGEQAFFSNQYNKALKSYSQARTVPYFPFFCHRAATQIYSKTGKKDQAIDYAKKALAAYPTDYITLSTLQNLLKSEGQANDNVEDEIYKIKKEHSLIAPLLNDDDTDLDDEEESAAKPISLGRQEIDDLMSLFQTPPPPEENAVAAEAALPPPSTALENASLLGLSIQEHRSQQTKKISQYILNAEDRSSTSDTFSILSGWTMRSNHEEAMFPEYSRKMGGGFLLRWNDKGVVINPGRSFLENFHAQGGHIRDIDYVVVTKDAEEAYFDVRNIYELNYHHNANSSTLHIIHYFFHPHVFHDLSLQLQPNFKGERNTVHSLELYIDSPERESLSLGDDIALSYFPLASPYKDKLNLGIRLDLSSLEAHRSIGFLSGGAWTRGLEKHLSGCDLLCASFEHTCEADYTKKQYNEDSLGYYGLYSLATDIQPQLLLCSEFNGREGDIRLEVIRELRHDISHAGNISTITLPADLGLDISLKNLSIRCSVGQDFVDASKIHITKPATPFGKLSFLSPASVL
jgi:tetratricopeptide (TPR) repeat protein